MSQPRDRSGVSTSSALALTVGVKELYSTGLYSDLTIVCRGREFRVHKAVLHTQSSVFRSMLGGKFRKTLALDHDDPDVLATLLHFLYNFTCPPNRSGGATNPEAQASSFTVHVYALADKYDVPALRSLAVAQLTRLLDPKRENLEGFLAAIRAIDECTADNTLWEIVIPRIVGNMAWLVEEEGFFALVQEMPGLNRKLLVGSAEGFGGGRAKAVVQPQAEEQDGYYSAGGRRLG
ncbi:hypothetical protein B0A55_07618 [Friedmanniomyces simplex]|uniref:BTB domain-containing protein n=1 Tax=Friedmanniomyces simplex TaxID=329884 RepID=A0A4U0XEU3_9PEZI|nr:hypothetical protein B0A55_07618 [Friedmanniomyces simplex]